VPAKRGLGISVLEAARARIAWVFDTFPRIYLSFSGGKDSTVMLHLVMEEAARRGQRIGVLFVDWEAQYQITISHVESCLAMYAEHIDPYWIALPLRTTNATSMIEPEWTCWEPGKEDRWVRPMPPQAISDPSAMPCYEADMTFEEFVPAFGHWYAQGELCACFVGIRTGESLNRWRTIAGHGTKFEGRNWTNYQAETLWNVYPIYDWRVADIWTYHARFPEKPYNRLYDLMHQAGMSPHSMRICEPYGDEQRKGLWLYHVIEPETWGRVVARVAGANSGALYAQEAGNVLGNLRVTKPEGHTWKSFAMLLLDTMPPQTAEHYRDKFAVWVRWYQERGREIEDELPGDTGSKDMPSWRRICKVLLRNDYWCKALAFGPTKTGAYEKYKKLMRKRRSQWGIFDETLG
jgi:predicted phosphoadenosine phosphosulfate sulfurtransferase